MSLPLFHENIDIAGDSRVPAYTRREHELRYELVLPYVKDKTVLDIGCGYGYGSAILAAVAKTVTAIDLNNEAISTAKARYCDVANLQFIQGDILKFLESASLSGDAVVLYEVIEHIEAHDQLLQQIWQTTAEGGRLFLSTPNRLKTPFYRKNPYHIRELSPEEIRKLVETWFEIDEVKGQISGLWAFFPQSLVAPLASKLKIHDRIVRLNDKPENSMTIILSGIRRELP